MIYGYMINTDKSKEYIEEAYFDNKIELLDEQVQVINEMHFSKKDLQDPKTIEKILKRKEFFDNCVGFIGFLEVALVILTSIVIGIFTLAIGGILAFPILMFAIASTFETLLALPDKWYVKQSDKFEKKVRELQEKTKQKMEKDPKNKDKYKKIIDNTQKVIDIIEKRREEAEKRYEEEIHKEELAYYEQVPEWLQNPWSFGHTGNGGKFSEWLYCAKFLKVKDASIIKAIEKSIKTTDAFYKVTVYGEYKDYKGRTVEVYNEDDIGEWITLHDHDYDRAIEELGEHIWQIQSDDSYGIWYTETKKFIESDVDMPYEFISLDELAMEGKKTLPEDIDQLLIDADKELGYYRLSKCPDQVKKKKFPV